MHFFICKIRVCSKRNFKKSLEPICTSSMHSFSKTIKYISKRKYLENFIKGLGLSNP